MVLSAEYISGRKSHFTILSSLHSFSPKKFQESGEDGTIAWGSLVRFLLQTLAGPAKSNILLHYLNNFFLLLLFLKTPLGTEYLRWS